MGKLLASHKTRSDCTPQATPPVIMIFHPDFPKTSLLTRKHIPMMAVVRRMLAAFKPRNSPLPLAMGATNHDGTGVIVFKRMTKKNATMNSGKEPSTVLYFETLRP